MTPTRRHRTASIAAAGALLAASFASATGAAGAGDQPPRPVADARAAGPQSGSGRLTGTVVIGARLSSKRVRFNLYPDLSIPAAAVAVARPEPPDELSNVVVYLEPAGASAVAAPGAAARSGATEPDGRRVAPRAMRQEGESFVPHVLPIVKGTIVEFPNADPIFHNVFSLSKSASFDLGRFPRGSSKSVTFEQPGIVKVFCHIHSDMSAVIMVLDNPFFATPDARGRFLIGAIPPGDYTAVAWHERARPLHRKVRIEAGSEAVVDFTIPLTEPSDGE